MTDRKVKVSLSAQIAGYKADMEEAARVTRGVAAEADKLAQTKQHFDMLGRSAVAAGGLMAVGLGVAVAKWAEFDQAMSAVQAATHESEENMLKLKDAAIEAGARTVFSAKEAANAIEELAKAGISTTDILNGGLNGALDLAAAGGIGVAEAAGIAATALQQFHLDGSDASHVADLLAAGAGKAMGDVTDLSQALNQGGLVANQFGLSIEETVGTLSAFASNGLLGSDAGTSFKTMLQRLVPQSKQAAEQMDALGLSAFDSQGQFIGMAEYAGKLHDALYDMDDQQKNTTLSVLFGSDAVRAASVIMDEGADGIQKWIDKANDQGYAAETAALRLDNLKGDIEKFQGAIDSAAISMGEAADGPLRFLVQGLTDLVDTFNGLPAGGKQAVFWVGAAGAAALTAYGSYLLLIPKIAEYNAALATMGTTAQRTGRLLKGALAGAGIAAGALVGIDLLNTLLEKFRATDEEIKNLVTTSKNADEILFKAFDGIATGTTFDNGAQQIKDFTGTVAELVKLSDNFWERFAPTEDVNKAQAAILPLEKIGKGLRELFDVDPGKALDAFDLFIEKTDGSDRQITELINRMPEFKKALTDQATEMGLTADAATLLGIATGDIELPTTKAAEAAKENEDALRALSGQAEDTGTDIDKLADQIRGFGSASLDTRAAQRGFQEAIDDLNASIKENGKTLDTHGEKGRANEAALDDLAKSTLDWAAATVEQTGKQEDANNVIVEGREQLIKMLGKFGIVGDAAEAYADQLGLIPDNVDTAVTANMSEAERAVRNFITTYDGKEITLKLRADDVVVNGKVYGGLRDGHATGGAIYGPGSGTSDTAGVFPLSNGEHVLTKVDVDAMGGQNMVYAFRQGLHDGSRTGATAAPVTANNYTFNGQYAVTPEQIIAEVEKRQRRANARAGVR